MTFTTGDVALALDMLESTKRIQRLVVKPNAARPGWLPALPPDPAWTASPDVSSGDGPQAVEAPVQGAADADGGPDVGLITEDATVPTEPVLDPQQWAI